MISAQPALKPTILSLIPRPTLDAALQGLANSAQKLKDAYPYSNTLFSQPPHSSFSNPGGFGSSRSSTASFSAGFGFGARPVGGTGFGSGSSSAPNGGMREEYIVSRLRPHIQEFVCMPLLSSLFLHRCSLRTRVVFKVPSRTVPCLRTSPTAQRQVTPDGNIPLPLRSHLAHPVTTPTHSGVPCPHACLSSSGGVEGLGRPCR